MSETKKKKKNSWLSILRRDPSSRHSMIETGSERNLDKSLDDVSPTRETPGTVTTGSLDRLTALNSKPPKSGFFYLKPKTPPFWKPLFPNSSSSQLISTPKKSQLVQTDSPTHAPTIDFGVQAVIVGRSAHTRDVLVQTCPAWEDRPPVLGDGLAETSGNGDPNKGRGTVNTVSNCIESSELFIHPLESAVTNGSCSRIDTTNSEENSERNKESSSPKPSPADQNCEILKNLDEETGDSPTLAERNGGWPATRIDAFGIVNSNFNNTNEPYLDNIENLVMEGLLCYRPFDSVSSAPAHPLSAVRDEFAQLNRDLESFADFSDDISYGVEPDVKHGVKPDTIKPDGIKIDPAFNFLMDDSSQTDLVGEEDVVSPKASDKEEGEESEKNYNQGIPNIHGNEKNPSTCGSGNKNCHENIEDIPPEEMGSCTSDRLKSDTHVMPRVPSARDSVSDAGAPHEEISNFDSCYNLDELEDEIIRSLCSPVISDPENSANQKEEEEQTDTQTVRITEDGSESYLVTEVDQFVADDSGQQSLVDSSQERVENMIIIEEEDRHQEPTVCGVRKRLYFPLENITEESNTDEGSVSPYRPLSWCDDDDAAAGGGGERAKTSESSAGKEDKTQHANLELVGGNKPPAADDGNGPREPIIVADSNCESTNETSQVVIELPPRRAKIFVNVLEVGNLRRTLSGSSCSPGEGPNDPVNPTVTRHEISNNSSKTSHFVKEAPLSCPGNDPKLNGSVEGEIIADPLGSLVGPSATKSTSEGELDLIGEFESLGDNGDKKCVVSKTEIVLKPNPIPPKMSTITTTGSTHEDEPDSTVQCTQPPPPPPPMPTSDDLRKASADVNRVSGGTSRSPDRNLRNRSASPVGGGKSAVMRELEQKFLTRQKMANDLEHITKKIAQDINKESVPAHSLHDGNKANTVYDSVKFSSPKGYQRQNGVQNGTAETWERTYSPTSPPKSPAAGMTNGNSDSRFAGQTVITDQPPPPGAVLVDSKVTVEGDKVHTDRYYALPVKEVLKEKTTTTKFIPAPEKYDGIGPTEEGIPVALRQSVKKENMSDWYKTMYKTLHKIDNEGDTYVIGYTSDSESKKEDKRPSPRKDIRIDDTVNRSGFSSGPVSPNYPPTAKSSVKIYSVTPGSIENYQPGHSAVVSEKDFTSKRNMPDLNVPKSSYEMKDGYDLDVSFVKKQSPSNVISPEDQKVWYRQVQKGGDVPQYGLNKPAPEKPKDPVIGPPPLPPQPMYSNQPLPSQKVSRPETLPPEYANNMDNGLFTQSNGAYAQHMRQIIQSELQQKSYRVSSPQNSKPFRKYPEKKILAKTLYTFRAETPREISLSKGDLVYIYRELDKNWYEGECDGLVGIFPISYVEVLPPEHTKKNEIKEGFAKVLYDFNAHTNVELSAKKGNEIYLIRKVDANWYEARIRDRRGIIPCTYVNVIQEPGSGHHSPAQGMFSPRSFKDSHSSPISSPSLSTKSVSSNASPYSQNGHGCLRTKKGSRLIEPVLYRALYRYSPQNADELELIEGDTLYVVEICDDGWFVGTSVRTGEVGIVPGNYLERV